MSGFGDPSYSKTIVDPRINGTRQTGAVGNRAYRVGVNAGRLGNRTYRSSVAFTFFDEDVALFLVEEFFYFFDGFGNEVFFLRQMRGCLLCQGEGRLFRRVLIDILRKQLGGKWGKISSSRPPHSV